MTVRYASPSWSPDSRALAAFRVDPGNVGDVHLIESSPSGGGRAKLSTRPYALPGDRFPAYEVNLIDVESGRATKPEVERIDFGFPRLRWNRDGSAFTYVKVDRSHQRLRLIEVAARSGQARTLIDEKSETFIWTAHGPRDGERPYFYYLDSSTAALLHHPDFYKVAVSACGCHDNRMDKASPTDPSDWNEQWMGYPVGTHYAASSNIDNAGKLRGKLLRIVGEMDTNVPPESTMRLVDALIKAGKDFDLLVMPGFNHTSGGAYGDRRRNDFFVRHLLGVDPPDRNAPR